MGKKILRIGFVLAMVGAIVFAVLFVAGLPEEERENSRKAEPKGLALEVRDKFAEKVEGTLGGTEAKLGLAYLAGMKSGLDDKTQEMLRLVGLTHIVVASGTHLSIIVEFFKKRFGKISRFAGLLFAAVFIIIFAQIIGWTASITRAAIVSLLGLLGWYYGRKMDAWRIILFAMGVTLLINPLYLVNLGWQLSFASFAGILILNPLFTQFFFGRKGREKPGLIAETLLASVSATLMCAPILIYYFGTISLISLVANILILPTIPFAMGMTFLTGLSGFLPAFFIFDGLKAIVVKIATISLDYHLFVIEFFSKQTSFIINLPKNDAKIFLLYIPILLPFIILEFKNYRRKREATRRIRENPQELLPFGAS